MNLRLVTTDDLTTIEAAPRAVLARILHGAARAAIIMEDARVDEDTLYAFLVGDVEPGGWWAVESEGAVCSPAEGHAITRAAGLVPAWDAQ